MVSFRVVRVQFERALKRTFSSGPVPFKIKLEVPKRVVRLGQRIVYLQGSGRGCSGLYYCLLRREFGNTTVGVTVRQSRIRQSIARVFLNRLLIVIDGFVVSRYRPLIKEMEAFQIEMISFCVFRKSFVESHLLFARQ